MSTPPGDDRFLADLESAVKAELAEFEDGPQVAAPLAEWLVDPVDVEREEVGLRNLLGAVETLEDGRRAGDEDSNRP